MHEGTERPLPRRPGRELASAAPLPTLEAALERIAAVDPSDYARTRNHLDGAVSGLSPYLTHGIVCLRAVLSGVAERHALDIQHKWVYELGWRAFHLHVWAHRGEGIFRSLHDGVLPDAAYAQDLPLDVREGRTGVPAIDQAVRTLYQTGLLHNHARMWLASYVVHVRKVHWRAGADWLYSHLLDGDLASNHLSWQWVAGTGSTKPYLFNAENVARYAPASWHSPGSVIDVTYEALDRLARRSSAEASDAPMVTSRAAGTTGHAQPGRLSAPPPDLGFQDPDAALATGRDVWLVHPWSLGECPSAVHADALVIGVAVAAFHRRWPWDERRWRFVGERMAELTSVRWFGDAAALRTALAGARSVQVHADLHMTPWLVNHPASASHVPWTVHTESTLFAPVEPLCTSFSQWWRRTTRGLSSANDLLQQHPRAAETSSRFTPGTSP